MSQLTPTQVEQLKEIGDKLRQARQEQSIQFEEVKVKTYIPIRVLQALEAAQTEQLPEPVFIRGFIRRYADALGLDGVAISLSFMLDDSLPTSSLSPALVPLDTPSPNRPTISFPPLRPYLPIAAIVLVSLGLIALAPQLGKLVAANRSTSKPSPTPVASPAPTPTPLASPKPSPIISGVEVAINLTDDSWMQVLIDGKSEFEGVLPKGSTRTWKAKDKLTLQVGNAGAVALSFNQAPAKVVGALGEVRELTFTPKGLQTSAQP